MFKNLQFLLGVIFILLFCCDASFAVSGHPFIPPSQIDAKNFTFEQLQRAAEAGDPDAQYMIGYEYYYGKRVSQNVPTALNWIKRASVQGQNEAIKALSVLNKPASQPRRYAYSKITPLNAHLKCGHSKSIIHSKKTKKRIHKKK